jgi:hypothetical protein
MNTLFFADEQVIIADNEDDLQRGIYKLSDVVNNKPIEQNQF